MTSLLFYFVLIRAVQTIFIIEIAAAAQSEFSWLYDSLSKQISAYGPDHTESTLAAGSGFL